jgi:hypothetical protein
LSGTIPASDVERAIIGDVDIEHVFDAAPEVQLEAIAVDQDVLVARDDILRVGIVVAQPACRRDTVNRAYTLAGRDAVRDGVGLVLQRVARPLLDDGLRLWRRGAAALLDHVCELVRDETTVGRRRGKGHVIAARNRVGTECRHVGLSAERCADAGEIAGKRRLHLRLERERIARGRERACLL